MSEKVETKKKKAWYIQPRNIVSAIAAVIFLILIFQNWKSVEVEVLFWTKMVPASLVYLFFAALGFGTAWLTLRRKPKGSGKKGSGDKSK